MAPLLSVLSTPFSPRLNVVAVRGWRVAPGPCLQTPVLTYDHDRLPIEHHTFPPILMSLAGEFSRCVFEILCVSFIARPSCSLVIKYVKFNVGVGVGVKVRNFRCSPYH